MWLATPGHAAATPDEDSFNAERETTQRAIEDGGRSSPRA